MHENVQDCKSEAPLTIGKVSAVDVPTADNKVVGVNHWKDGVERNVDILALGVGANLDSGGLAEGAEVVGLFLSFLGRPRDVVFVGEDTGGDS